MHATAQRDTPSRVAIAHIPAPGGAEPAANEDDARGPSADSRPGAQGNPNATDRSTILISAENAEMVLAYDAAMGGMDSSRITAKDLLASRLLAHWMMLKEAEFSLPCVKQFVDY